MIDVNHLLIRGRTAALCLLICLAAVSEAQPVKPDAAALEKYRQARSDIAHRQRRMIFNNDGDDHLLRGDFSIEAFLAKRSTPIIGSQVDTIVYCTSRPFGLFLHRTQIGDVFTNEEAFLPDRTNVVADMIERGTDPLSTMIDFCRANDLEIFWSMRMDDTHDGAHSAENPHHYWSSFKAEHPEALVGSRERRPPHGVWTAVDYAHPEVRDFLFRIFQELCRNYDIDGIEMDFFRHPCLFKSVAWGGEASQAELQMMTDLVRRIRQMTEEEGMRRGKPILLTMRIPDSVEYAKAIGLDVETWLAEGLVDILSGSDYFRLNHWDVLVDLGHRYGIPVYPSLSDPRVPGETRFQRKSLECFRARAAQAWDAGGDGIYMFNYFNPKAAIWHELGDPEALETMDKLYFVTVVDGSPNRYLADGVRYRRVPVVTPDNVRLLHASAPTVLDLHVAEDLDQPRQPTVICHVRALGPPSLAVTMNGTPLSAPSRTRDWFDFRVPRKVLQHGINKIAIATPEQRSTAASAPWTVAWDGSSLPGKEWVKSGWSTGCVAELQDDALLIADRSTEQGSWGYFRHPSFIDPARETVIEVRLKTLSGESNIILENGVARELVTFETDAVRLRHAGLQAAVTTDDDFHDYRLVVHGPDIQITMDGKLILDGTGQYTHQPPRKNSGIAFGAASSGSTGEALWQQVRIRNPATTLLDVVLSVTYGK